MFSTDRRGRSSVTAAERKLEDTEINEKVCTLNRFASL